MSLILLLSTLAFAGDYEREVRDGITSFKRFTDGDRPQNIYAVRVDLSVPNVGLHASADLRGTEWYTDTLGFAEEVGAVAAINGDWSCTTCSGSDYLHPLGLAISSGMVWNDHVETDAIGSRWGYLACTIDKRCDLEQAAPLGDESMVFRRRGRTRSCTPACWRRDIAGTGRSGPARRVGRPRHPVSACGSRRRHRDSHATCRGARCCGGPLM